MFFNNFIFRLGALNACSSIIIQAIGGHKPWDIDRKLIFNKAFELHITSAIGMILSSFKQESMFIIPSTLFLFGIVLYSGFAYYRCFKDSKQFNYLMPSGGSCIILAWLSLALLP